MIDFMLISTRSTKNGVIEIYPNFILKRSSDLMIRGSDFYAIWIEELKLWSTEEEDVIRLVDGELDKYADENRERFPNGYRVLHMWDSSSGVIDSWHKYCQKQMRDSYHMLDEKLIFANTKTTKSDYASKKLPYSLEEGDYSAYDKLVSTLYLPEERHKLEWAIGSIITGDSKKIQKFIVLYGEAGSGKSTIINLIQLLFEGYYSVFDAKALGSSSNAFALEAFRSNPLIAIQHDGDLSKIEDNTRINSLVSHEMMTVNEKFKSTYASRFKCFLFMGTNKPVRISDARSGIIRRLIDVAPSGNKLSLSEYSATVKQTTFELGAIAYHCREVYLQDPDFYNNYIPIAMLGASNDFYNFVADSYYVFSKDNGTTLKASWEMYKTYCDDAKVQFPFSQRTFKEELKSYFKEYKERAVLDDGTRARSLYLNFRKEKFGGEDKKDAPNENALYKISFDSDESIFDKECADMPAQYATENGTPSNKWSTVTTKLSEIDTHQPHYVKLPENHIVIDFDIPDSSGEKDFEKNLEEASKWPPTYSELSKSEKGIHLHYIYNGDTTKLSRIYDEHIEIKVFTGNSSLRRKLTKCNSLPIANIGSGLPLKKEGKVLEQNTIKSEKGLRALIIRNLNKEIHPGTKPSIDFIYSILQDAYEGGLKYDVSDMRNAVLAFAAHSTHQADYCIALVGKMQFKSETPSDNIKSDSEKLVFFDIEVFPNLFLVNWKLQGENPIVRMYNPSPTDIEELLQYKLIGFNCRRYDNHLLYACLMGYDNTQIYNLSQRIIGGDRTAFFGEAYNLSYTDIYDFSSEKKSLKKFEIELGIHHQELGLPWDKPVPKELWPKVAEYCDNDVIASEAVFNSKDRKSDFLARQILADVAGLTVNDTTNTLTAKIIFGNDRHPQDQFQYRNLGGTSSDETSGVVVTSDLTLYDNFGDEYTMFDKAGRPIFPGYKYENGKSTYRDEDPKEGGYVYSEPGMYANAALLDIASMHPSSIIAENLFGDKYTSRFRELRDIRVAIKHGDFDEAKKMLGGVLEKYMSDKDAAAKLSKALKIPINAVYGLTSARFSNPFRDPRNVDNIVAKRGALFMINLKHMVQNKGYTVAHIKTDSIKIPNATPEIIQFVFDYGKQYGYIFEHEATYDRICLVNDAVYVAKYATVEKCYELYGKDYVERDRDTLKDNKEHPNTWTATGTQFQIPYVFKRLFSKEDLKFEDMCETKSVESNLYLDKNENLPEGEHNYQFIGRVGSFCPIKEGCEGGVLYREKDGKYYSATGTKGYRWLEAETVFAAGKQNDIDNTYYDNLVTEAVNTISKFGDFEWFVSEDN